MEGILPNVSNFNYNETENATSTSAPDAADPETERIYVVQFLVWGNHHIRRVFLFFKGDPKGEAETPGLYDPYKRSYTKSNWYDRNTFSASTLSPSPSGIFEDTRESLSEMIVPIAVFLICLIFFLTVLWIMKQRILSVFKKYQLRKSNNKNSNLMFQHSSIQNEYISQDGGKKTKYGFQTQTEQEARTGTGTFTRIDYSQYPRIGLNGVSIFDASTLTTVNTPPGNTV